MSARALWRERDRRVWIYAILDGFFLIFYLLLAIQLAPARGGLASALQWSLVGAMALALGGLLLPNRWGWRLSSAGCALLLLAELLLLVLLLISASYLSGVYGSFGQAASSLALVVAALSVELVALVPAFQLSFLRTRRGRRAFGAPWQ